MRSPLQQRIAADRLRVQREVRREREMARLVDTLTRAHAQVSNELRNKLGVEYLIADGEEIFEIPDSNVRGFTDTTEMDDRSGMIRRQASVRLIAFTPDDNLNKVMHYRFSARSVAYRGVRWSLDYIDAQPIHDFPLGGVGYTAHMSAIGKARK